MEETVAQRCPGWEVRPIGGSVCGLVCGSVPGAAILNDLGRPRILKMPGKQALNHILSLEQSPLALRRIDLADRHLGKRVELLLDLFPAPKELFPLQAIQHASP